MGNIWVMMVNGLLNGFPEMGSTPIAAWFIRGHPGKMDDLGVPPFEEMPMCYV